MLFWGETVQRYGFTLAMFPANGIRTSYHASMHISREQLFNRMHANSSFKGSSCKAQIDVVIGIQLSQLFASQVTQQTGELDYKNYRKCILRIQKPTYINHLKEHILQATVREPISKHKRLGFITIRQGN